MLMAAVIVAVIGSASGAGDMSKLCLHIAVFSSRGSRVAAAQIWSVTAEAASTVPGVAGQECV